ncbi:acyl-CoA dehydrogenase family protein [Streptomyces sp. NPDC093252]|uniref:acyl-CoA dehydrogenase family protein n=1 Tax=Streptomyces sp. NPDC093252 TaxID=3154980 RepID=UPI0034365744
MPDLQALHAVPGTETPDPDPGSDPHRDLRARVRDFARTEIAPRIPGMESTGAVEDGLVTEMARMGWIGITVPAAHGGMDVGHTAKTVLVEELSYMSAAMGAAVQASVLGTAMIQHFGTEEQRNTWLPAVADGSVLPTIAVTEHDSGGHVLGMTSTGRRRGRTWVLSGRKVYVGNSHVAHVHGVVVRTGKGSRGLSTFLVEADREGVRLAPHTPRLGLRGFSFGELVLDGVRVPDSHRIGEVGDGLDVAYSSSVLVGRLNLAAVALGILSATRDQVTAHVRNRPRPSPPSASHHRSEPSCVLHPPAPRTPPGPYCCCAAGPRRHSSRRTALGPCPRLPDRVRHPLRRSPGPDCDHAPRLPGPLDPDRPRLPRGRGGFPLRDRPLGRPPDRRRTAAGHPRHP